MHVIHQLSEQQVRELHLLYQGEWWSQGRTLEETKACVDGSLCFALIDDGDRLQGFARVLSDYIFKALIFDVIVAPAYRNNGLGENLIKAIKNHSSLQQVKHFELYCLDDRVPFYQRLGFSCDVGGMQLMRFSAR